MTVDSSRCIRNRSAALLALLAVFATAPGAQATLVGLYYEPTVISGGSFVDPNLVANEFSNVSVAADRMSFSVAGNYSVLADGSSSEVSVSIYTALLTPDIQGSFDVNTSIDGIFAYSSPSAVALAPQITEYSVSSDLMGVGGVSTVSLPSSPLSLPSAANFPLDGLELTGSSSAVATIPEGVVFRGYLEQMTTITFDNVVAGETIDIQLPNTTAITAVSSVPEPSALLLLVLGLVLPATPLLRRVGTATKAR